MIHLDTGFLILSLLENSPESLKLKQWLNAGEEIGMSAISWAEFLCGPLSIEAAHLALRIVGEPIAFSTEDAEKSAELFNLSGRRRGSFADCMIAAVALKKGAHLATTNKVDFQRLIPAGLQLKTA